MKFYLTTLLALLPLALAAQFKSVIVKENTEHAMAISRVLEKHIRSVKVYSFPADEIVF